MNPLAGKAEHYAWKATDIRLLDRPADDDYIPKVLFACTSENGAAWARWVFGFVVPGGGVIVCVFVRSHKHAHSRQANPMQMESTLRLCSRCCLFVSLLAAGHVKVYAIWACADVSGT